MSAPSYDDRLTAAILSDKVYQSKLSNGQQFTRLGDWERVRVSYDKETGYYGEAWAKRAPDGTYSQLMIVSRGTVESRPDSTSGVLAQNYDNDRSKTRAVDFEIIGQRSGNYSPNDQNPPIGSVDPHSLVISTADTATAKYVTRLSRRCQ